MSRIKKRSIDTRPWYGFIQNVNYSPEFTEKCLQSIISGQMTQRDEEKILIFIDQQ